ncbi:EI24 domain-containing protein [Acidisphaera rubrifaciens]|uniref:Uncharacterized protein n=1 Tax=Acidisphaera rubrifaciens HS-AP3 TaxID=1231350 RepID=A0A0D6PAH8_9PROT|nr:EI24 domain-containing protein [Acidisphaera rubrifaciens]GAN78371.1 hypothetical protein Asru_0794_02 [Acidisphaera rubrifaciens HS-AP3]
MRPILLALEQLDDPALQAVLWRSLALAAACFALVWVGVAYGVHGLAGLHGWLAWVAGLASGVLTALLAFWLFVPLAAGIGTLFIERIARAVERRHYPRLPPAAGASLAVQVWDGVVVGLRILLLNVAALALAILIPGVGAVLGLLVTAYAIGRGLFVAVALRRLDRAAAESVYRRNRAAILGYGLVLAVAAYVPLINLLVPVVSIAAMVHVLDAALTPAGRA